MRRFFAETASPFRNFKSKTGGWLVKVVKRTAFYARANPRVL
jgi:hypothetical protein